MMYLEGLYEEWRKLDARRSEDVTRADKLTAQIERIKELIKSEESKVQ